MLGACSTSDSLRNLQRAATLAAAWLLTACGGGLSLGVSADAFDRTPPAVAITASATTVKAGSTLRLAAAASDAGGVESVSFLRLDGQNSVVLATVGVAPYEISVQAPADGRAVLTVFARAIDRAGNRGESAQLNITVTP